MNTSKLRPKVVLWWGIGLTLAGGLMSIAAPQIGYTSFVAVNYSAAGLDRAVLVLVALVVRTIDQVLIPLGVALIGSSVVMAYLRPAPAATSGDTKPLSAEQ